MNMGSMVVDSPHDLVVFFLSFVCGQVIGVLLDVFRALRCVYPPGKNMMAAQDILFCALAFFLFSETIGVFNLGDVRWFEVAATILGFILYLSAESRLIKGVFVNFFTLWDRVIKRIIDFLCACINIIRKPFSALKKQILKLSDKCKCVFRGKCTKKLRLKR